VARRRDSLWWKLLPPLFLGMAAFVGLAVYAHWGDLVKALAGFRVWFLLPVLGLASLNYLTRFLRWQYYLRRCEIDVGARLSAGVFFSGLAMSITPGKFGELFKSLLLKEKAGVRIATSAPVVIVERLTDLVGVLLLMGVGLTRYSSGRIVFVAGAALVVVLFLGLAFSPRLLQRLVPLLARSWLKDKGTEGMQESTRTFALLLRPGAFLVGSGLGVVAWFWECLAFYLVFIGLGWHGLTLFTATFVYAAATLAGALSMLPGGLGMTEGSMAGLLVAFDVGRQTAAAGVLVTRACTLWFAVLVGVVSYALQRRRVGPVAAGDTAAERAPPSTDRHDD